MTQVGVPIRLLHEGEGHIVSIELRNGMDALEIASTRIFHILTFAPSSSA